MNDFVISSAPPPPLVCALLYERDIPSMFKVNNLKNGKNVSAFCFSKIPFALLF